MSLNKKERENICVKPRRYTMRHLLAKMAQHLSDDVHECCGLLGDSVDTVKYWPTLYKYPIYWILVQCIYAFVVDA